VFVDLAQAERFKYGVPFTHDDRADSPGGDVDLRALNPDLPGCKRPGARILE
jgi:hypothetical protein